MSDLQVAADEAIAIEDTGICARAAQAAGVRTYGWSNAYAEKADFPEGVHLVDDVAHLLDQVEEPTG